MTALGLVLVGVYGLRMPFADEWRWLPVVAGAEPCSPGWLLSFDNEHRLILPKLIYLGLARASGGSFCAGTFFNVAMLGAAAALLLGAIRGERGHLRLADGFFPLLLLNGAQYDNLFWGFQLHFVVSVFLILVVLVIVFRLGDTLGVAAGAAVAAALAAASASGAYGLAFVPPFACWLAYAAATGGRGQGSRRRGAALACLAVLLAAVVPLWWIGYPGPAEQYFPAPARASPGVGARLAVSLELLSVGFGPAAKALWPVSGVVVAGLCVVSAGQLMAVGWARPADRLRALGMLAVLAGTLSLALAVGWSRAFLGPRSGFESRYVTLLIPLVCLFYLQTQAFPGPRSARLQNAMLVLSCVLAAVGGVRGLRGAAALQLPLEALRADARAGLTDPELARRHTQDNFILAGEDEFALWLAILRQRGWPPFDGAGPPDPSLGIVPLAALEPGCVPPRSTLRLSASQRHAEVFAPKRSGRLWRIDVQVGRCRWGRSVDEFAWQLRVADPAQHGRLLAEGRCDYRQCAQSRWVTLPITPVAIEAGCPLELLLEVPGEARTGCRLEIPLYAGDGAPRRSPEKGRLKAFAYLRSPRGDAP